MKNKHQIADIKKKLTKVSLTVTHMIQMLSFCVPF